jgi:hypothetical protein
MVLGVSPEQFGIVGDRGWLLTAAAAKTEQGKKFSIARRCS